jgi:hypothetical protein
MRNELQHTCFANITRVYEVFEGRVVVAERTQWVSFSVATAEGEQDQLKGIERAHCTTVQFDITSLREAADFLAGWAEESGWPRRDVTHVALAYPAQAQRFSCTNRTHYYSG